MRTVIQLVLVLSLTGCRWLDKDDDKKAKPKDKPAPQSVACGNGVVDLGEECEVGQGDADCTDLGFDGGELSCVDCVYDFDACTTATPDDDSDDDGVDDETDNCPALPNAEQADEDDDGVGSGCDNCPDLANASQLDDDEDGVGNGCDALAADGDNDGVDDDVDNCADAPNFAQNDSDDDGVGDVCDNCLDDANFDQADDDEDGVGDACDARPADHDNDGVPDVQDNCYAVANAAQVDADDDGVGSACDNCPDVSNGLQHDGDDNGVGDACEVVIEDGDDDGIADDEDNCPLDANEDQYDFDDDGMGDVCDTIWTSGEVEPNNSYAQAKVLDLTLGVPAKLMLIGSLGAQDVRDYWQIDLHGPVIATVQLAALVGHDVDLEGYANQTYFSSETANDIEESTVTFAGSAAHYLFLLPHHFSGATGTYVMTVTFHQP